MAKVDLAQLPLRASSPARLLLTALAMPLGSIAGLLVIDFQKNHTREVQLAAQASVDRAAKGHGVILCPTTEPTGKTGTVAFGAAQLADNATLRGTLTRQLLAGNCKAPDQPAK